MILLLSPSKTQNFEPIDLKFTPTIPSFAQNSLQLVQKLQTLDPKALSKLMAISPNLAELNYQRFQSFQDQFNLKNSKPAIFAFEGDVYTDIDAHNYSLEQLDFANKTIRILSGLYGILQPFDLIQPYRLEMKTKLAVNNHPNLYQFWGSSLTDYLNKQNPNFIINLASEEYFKAIQPQNLTSPVITISFKEKRNDAYKIVPIYAKKARGTMANYIVQQQINDPEKIKTFNQYNYRFNSSLSNPTELIFTR